MQSPQLLLDRILAALGSSTLLLATSCGGEAELPIRPDAGELDAPLDSDAVTPEDAEADAAADHDGPDVGDNLASLPVPDGGYPSCVGETTEYVGPCCANVYCYTPEAGACPLPDDVTQQELGVNAPGSGTCECGRTGPYNSKGASDYTDKLGACCYVVGTQSCMGRPLTVGGAIRTAEVRAGAGWAEVEPVTGTAWDNLSSIASDLPRGLRRHIAEQWARDGLMEHASVASFNRFSMQLLAVGAPAHLVDLAQRAALEEVRHARSCFAIASGYIGRKMAPGPISLAGNVLGETELLAIALATVREGCIGETIAAVEASTAAKHAVPTVVSRALEAIADDEAKHAELAWQFVKWAIAQGGDRIKSAVEAELREAMRVPADDDSPSPWDDVLREHGHLSASERREVFLRCVEQVIRPAAEALLEE